MTVLTFGTTKVLRHILDYMITPMDKISKKKTETLFHDSCTISSLAISTFELSRDKSKYILLNWFLTFCALKVECACKFNYFFFKVSLTLVSQCHLAYSSNVNVFFSVKVTSVIYIRGVRTDWELIIQLICPHPTTRVWTKSPHLQLRTHYHPIF